MRVDNEDTYEHFCEHGWLRVRAAFSAAEAAAMRAVAWEALAGGGILQKDPSTWSRERPDRLQHVKTHPAFRAVGSDRLVRALDTVLGGQTYGMPANWGALFLTFPSRQPWVLPASGWHADANYLSALSPPAGVRTHALFGDVAARAGGTLIVSGSHRLVHQYFRDYPPPPGTRGAGYRQLLRGHPYIGDLHADGDTGGRTLRFMNRTEVHGGIPLRVVENTGSAGDVLVLHPLLLHVAATNSGTTPRFLLSGGVDLPQMWPATAVNLPVDTPYLEA